MHFADVIHQGQFTSQAELKAAERTDLEDLGIPKGAAGLIIAAARATGNAFVPFFSFLYTFLVLRIWLQKVHCSFTPSPSISIPCCLSLHVLLQSFQHIHSGVQSMPCNLLLILYVLARHVAGLTYQQTMVLPLMFGACMA